MHIFQEGEGQPFKKPWELSMESRPPTRIDQGFGKLEFEPQERWESVCGGGDGESAPSFPLKLEWSSSSMK